MYVTRPLSMYRRSPDSLSLPTPEGPNSGYLVLHDEESDETTCFGCCKDRRVKALPFPQNKDIIVSLTNDTHISVAFIPVLDKPLSASTYYVTLWHGRHRGKVYTNSKEEDMTDSCCCGRTVRDVKPKPLDPSDMYQQVEIVPMKHRGHFTAKAAAPDGVPPTFLRRKGWPATMNTFHHYQLGEALGLDASKRSALPGFYFPLSKDCSEAMVVGKWYCPFLFIKEGGLKLKHQMKQCMFYEVGLEQRWEKIFDKYNENNNANTVFVDTFVQSETVIVAGREAFSENLDRVHTADDGFMWFKSSDGAGGERSVGLSMKIIERMKWEQERVGWVGGDERKVRVKRSETFEGIGGWNRFACYVLVERFVLKRNDGSLPLLTYDFKHTHQIRCKWE